VPTYDYECAECKRQFELEQKISEPPAERCALCGAANPKRLISSGNFLLKGGGWYSDGYSK